MKRGDKFGRLTIIELLPQRRVRCLCDCGTERVAFQYNVKSGASASCGCLKSEVTAARSTKHGEARAGRQSPEYVAWMHIIDRCENQSNKDFRWYGARGISVSPKWRHDFSAFLADAGRRPSPLHSIDRIESNKNYEPGNVRWSTATEQARNTSRNAILEIDGVRKCISAWASDYGIGESCIRLRLKRGWSAKRAVSVPVRPMKIPSRAA